MFPELSKSRDLIYTQPLLELIGVQMGMKISDIAIGGYLPGQSLLHKLDPRTKLLGIIFLTIAIFSANGPIEVIANTIPVMFAVLISRAGWRIWLWGVSRFFFHVSCGSVAQCVFFIGPALLLS